MTAYQVSHDSTLKAAIDDWYAGMWGKPGLGTPPVPSLDGTYDQSFDSVGCVENPTYPIWTGCSGGYA